MNPLHDSFEVNIREEYTPKETSKKGNENRRLTIDRIIRINIDTMKAKQIMMEKDETVSHRLSF